MDNGKIYNGTQHKALALLSLLVFVTLTLTNLDKIRGRGKWHFLGLYLQNQGKL